MITSNPEYYEFVKKTQSGFTNGKIYRIINLNNLEDINNFINDYGETNGWSCMNHEYFKPSTLEEYNIQQGIKNIKIKQDYKYLIKILKKIK